VEWPTVQFIFGNKKSVSKLFQDILDLCQHYLRSSKKDTNHSYQEIKVVK